jgi:hypothetical protein
VVDFRTTVGELAQTICSTGLAAPAIHDGKYTVIEEHEPRVPVQMFTHRNTRGMSTSRVWIDAPHALKVRHISDQTWEREETFVFADGYDAMSATKIESLDLMGVVRGPQVWRQGRYFLAAAVLRKERMSLETDVENLVCQRGDLVLAAHDSLLGNQVGRVRDINGAVITVDIRLDVAPQAIQARDAEGRILQAEPIVRLIDTSTIEISPTLVAQLQPGCIVAFGDLQSTTSEWLVDKITPGSDFSARIELIEFAPAIHQADLGPIPPYVPPGHTGFLVNLSPVRSLLLYVNEYIYDVQGIPRHEVTVDWDAPLGWTPDHYIVERVYTRPTSLRLVAGQLGARVFLAKTTGTIWRDLVDAMDLDQGGNIVQYIVTPVSMSGRQGEEASASCTLFPDRTPPAKVRFATNILSETVMLIWEKPASPDILFYQIRFTQDVGAQVSWDHMIIVSERVAADTTTKTMHAQTGTYAIRAVDTSGNWSEPAYAMTMIQTLPNIDEVTRLEAHPAWAGTFDNTELQGGNLRLSQSPSGDYYPHGFFFPQSEVVYPRPWMFRLRGELDVRVQPPEDSFGDVNVEIWIGVRGDLPVLSDPWFEPLSHADPLSGKATNFVPLSYLLSTDIEGVAVSWALRLSTKRRDMTPVVHHASLIVDHAERREFGDDVAIQAGGQTIDFAYPFFAPPALAITLNDGQPGDVLIRQNTTGRSFSVEIQNNGTSVSRHIDWQAIGYGKGT